MIDDHILDIQQEHSLEQAQMREREKEKDEQKGCDHHQSLSYVSSYLQQITHYATRLIRIILPSQSTFF